jgi:hypothetical protein
MRRLAQTLAFPAALAALFALTTLFRFTALSNGFTNDQFFHLANAQQMLFGEWPTRDFLDTGMPLMYVVSALAQGWLGNTLFAEAVLVAAAFGLAAVLTAAAVRELTGSRALGLLAATLEVAIVPRAYGYPKILVYAAGFLLLQRYVTRPTRARLMALAAGVVIAFLFRHDHGIYLGLCGVLAAWLAPDAGGRRGGPPRAAAFAGICALLAMPYLVYVQIYDGIVPYLQKGLEFRHREFMRAEYVWPTVTGAQPLHAVLFYAYWAFPVLAAAMLLRRRRDQNRGGASAAPGEGPQVGPPGRADEPALAGRVAQRRGVPVERVVPLIVAALLLNATFARPPMNARLPDAIVPFVMLGAWLTISAWRARRRWIWRPVIAVLGGLVAVSVFAVDDTIDHLERSAVLAPFSEWPEYVANTRELLEAPHAEIVLPSRAAVELVPFYDYVARCTTSDHRVLVVGLIPEVVFFTHRPFAGGQAILPAGYFEAEKYQRAVVDKLSNENVPFVVIPGRRYIDDFNVSHPLVAGHVRQRYVPLATFGEDWTKVELLIDRTVSATSRDAVTGWPCLTQAPA